MAASRNLLRVGVKNAISKKGKSVLTTDERDTRRWKSDEMLKNATFPVFICG
jgi:hypothetical protein